MQYTSLDFREMDKQFRINMINTISGPRAAHLIGTCNANKQTNLAIFNSVFHVGANPPLLGMISRPDTVDRHTLTNIRNTGLYTINLVGHQFIEKAHQSSARYPEHISEFEACGLTAVWKEGFEAPFVKESPLHIGLRLEEIMDIKQNGTHLIIGEIIVLDVDENFIDSEGRVNIFDLQPALSVGLDTYGTGHKLTTLPYAKPDKEL